MREIPSLSGKQIEMLDHLANQYHASYAQVLDMLISDRYSVSNGEKNRLRKREAWKEFRSDHPNASVDGAWNAGYSAGWIQFQTRHNPDSPYILRDSITEDVPKDHSDEDRIALLEREVASIREVLSIAQLVWGRNEKP